MSITTQLFKGKSIRLGAIDHQRDPQVESRWTHDPAYLRDLSQEIARPLSPEKIKKKYEALEKEIEESKNTFYFTIRSCEDDRLLGFARIYWIEWSQGTGGLQIGIGDPRDRQKGYASEAMRLILRYAFAEVNLHRLSALVSEDNPAALHLFRKFGFVEEVRRRKAIQRNGAAHDLLLMGLLRQEWKPQ